MPHIVIEYSDNLKTDLETSELTKKLHKAVVEFGLFEPASVKARSLEYSDFVLTGAASSFIHVTVSILSGRTVEQRNALNDAVFKVISTAVPAAEKISSDIREMNAETYKK